jgi:hypothetical protein
MAADDPIVALDADQRDLIEAAIKAFGSTNPHVVVELVLEIDAPPQGDRQATVYQDGKPINWSTVHRL